MDTERQVLGTIANAIWIATIALTFGGLLLFISDWPDDGMRVTFTVLILLIGSSLLIVGAMNRDRWFQKISACAFLWSCGLAITLGGPAA